MKAIFPLVAVFAAVLTEVTSQSCASRSNGCSVPNNLPYFYKKRFKPSCDKHDVCYSCAVHYRKTKEDCDKMLLSDTTRACSSIFCKAISRTYYAATKHFGDPFFLTTSEGWCSESWVMNCMP